MFSAIDIGSRNGSWSTTATCERSLFSCRSRTSWPSMVTCPLQASWKRGTRLASVLLPAPVAPMIATVSPGRTSRLTSCSTGRPDS